MRDRVLTETHAHTREVSQCGWLFAKPLINELYDWSYGAVIITDHFLPGQYDTREKREGFLLGYRKAKEAGEASGITVLPGMEIRFKNHNEDFLVYGIEPEEILDLPDDICDQGIRAFHEMAKANGWAVYQAHPFRAKMLPADPSEIDGMETFNGNPRHDSKNRLATAFAARHGIRTIAGSDIHRPGDAGAVGLLVPRNALTPKAFAAWLLATPHPRVQYQQAPVDGIRYVDGAIPGRKMVEALYQDAGWPPASIPSMLRLMSERRDMWRIVTAWDDMTLIGMARAMTDDATTMVLREVLVLGPYRRRGIGRSLLRQLVGSLDGMNLAMAIAEDSVETREFLHACNFQTLGSRGQIGYVFIPR